MLLALTQDWARLTPIEQTRVQLHLADWAALTGAERQAARERFADIEALPPAERQARQARLEQDWLAREQAAALAAGPR